MEIRERLVGVVCEALGIDYLPGGGPQRAVQRVVDAVLAEFVDAGVSRLDWCDAGECGMVSLDERLCEALEGEHWLSNPTGRTYRVYLQPIGDGEGGEHG